MSLQNVSAHREDEGPRPDHAFDAFARQVRDALAHLYDPVYLQTHPLVRMAQREVGMAAVVAGRFLRQQILEAIAALRPDTDATARDPAGRRFQLLTLRYVEGLEVANVQTRLAVSRSEYFREQRRALDAVVSVLRERWNPLVDGPDITPPPLRSLRDAEERASRNGAPRAAPLLPLPLNSFIGREADLATVTQWLIGVAGDASAPRLVTLTGPPGTGKTRLAFEVGSQVQRHYQDGAWLVELAGLADPALVPQALAAILGVPEQAGQPLLATLVAAVGDRHLLLILDNCEHLLDACAPTAEALLRSCPRLCILATSRQPLGITGEVSWPVTPLALPPAGGGPALTDLACCDAVRLFLDRAAAAVPAFALTERNAPAVSEICRGLDGLPLALELAAARVKVLSAEQIAAHLDDRFGLLRAGSRTAPPRQQTLRATVDWSYDLLSSLERQLFDRLAVFAGGCALEALEAVGAGDGVPVERVLELLARLVDQSLVVVEQRDGAVRYRLLETMRAYGQERLLEAGDMERTRRKHSDWCLGLAAAGEAGLVTAEHGAWRERLELEHDNCRAALAWCVNNDPGCGLQLAAHLAWFWLAAAHLTEGRRWLAALLATPGHAVHRVKALVSAGMLAFYQGDGQHARLLLTESLASSQALDDTWSAGWSLRYLGHLAQSEDNDNATAQALMAESLALLRGIDDVYGTGMAYSCLGIHVLMDGDEGRAEQLFHEGLAYAQEHGDIMAVRRAGFRLGQLARQQGDYAQARAHFEANLATGRQNNQKGGFNVLGELAGLAQLEGDYAQAQVLSEERLRLLRDRGDRAGVASVLATQGNIARLQGERERARELLEQSLALYRELGNKRGMADVFHLLGNLALDARDESRAADWYASGLTLSRAIGDRHLSGLIQGNLGNLARRQQDAERARVCWLESLAQLQSCGHRWCHGWALAHMGMLAGECGDHERGVRLIAAATATHALFWTSLDPEQRRGCAASLSVSWSKLGEERYTACWTAGRALAVKDAIAAALANDGCSDER